MISSKNTYSSMHIHTPFQNSFEKIIIEGTPFHLDSFGIHTMTKEHQASTSLRTTDQT